MSQENNMEDVTREYQIEGFVDEEGLSKESRNMNNALFETGKSAAELVADGMNRATMEARFNYLQANLEDTENPLPEADKEKLRKQSRDIRAYLDEHPELA